MASGQTRSFWLVTSWGGELHLQFSKGLAQFPPSWSYCRWHSAAQLGKEHSHVVPTQGCRRGPLPSSLSVVIGDFPDPRRGRCIYPEWSRPLGRGTDCLAVVGASAHSQIVRSRLSCPPTQLGHLHTESLLAVGEEQTSVWASPSGTSSLTTSSWMWIRRQPSSCSCKRSFAVLR